MKDFLTADIRNSAIVGHASSGKTMLSECMLACAGVINRLGRIENGSTVSDYHEAEHERKNSIYATMLHCEWQGKKLNCIDTPGFLDFTAEPLGALRVADNAIVVIHAKDGVLVGTQKVWDYATQFGVPKLIVVNGLDREQVEFDRVLAQLREIFSPRIFPLTLPGMKVGPGFNTVRDVLKNASLVYEPNETGKFQETPLPTEEGKALFNQLVEFVAESDDILMEKFFETGRLSPEDLKQGLHAAYLKQSFIPLFVTASSTNVGVSRVLDFLAEFGVTPLDNAKIAAKDGNGAEVALDVQSHDPTLYVFKTANEAQAGHFAYFRVYSGKVAVGMDLYNTAKSVTERMGAMFVANGKTRTSVDHLNAGDIGAVVKLKNTHTTNTLSSPKHNVTLPPVVYPRPNIHSALRLKSKGDEDKIATGLASLHEEDPAFVYMVDAELRQTVLSGQGELHLLVATNRLKARFKVDIELVQPRIRFRETIKIPGDSKYRHKKQTGGAGQFAEVWMRIEPKPRDTGLEFTESLVGQNVDRVFVPSVEKGVNRACTEGVLAGYKVTDVKVDFYDGKMHPVDSKDIAFQIAGHEAFKEAFLKAHACLLEPIYVIEVRIPEECMGNVMGDLSSRRGKIMGMDSAPGGFQIVKAHVPAMELFHYSNTLRSLTGGRGLHTEDFNHYEELPKTLEAKVIEETKKAKEEADKG